MASTSVFSTSRIESPTKVVVSKAMAYFSPGGNRLRQPRQLGSHRFIDIERVGRRQLADADADTVVAVEAKLAAVVFGAQLRMSDIHQANQRAIAARLQDDVVELRRLGEPPDRAHADLVHLGGRRGLGADLAGGDLDVLLLQGGDDIGRGQPARRQPVRIEPETHGVLALAEDLHIGDALDALDRVLDVDVDVVADELVVVAIALAVEAGRKHERAGHLVDGDAGSSSLHPADVP